MPKIITKTGTPRSSDAATYVVGGTRPTASYIYLADGTKVQATGETGQGYEYVGSLRLSVNGSSAEVESIPFAGGRIVKTSNGYEPQYYITDHLGGTRTVVKPNATAGGSGIDASVFVGKSDALTLDRLIGNFINAGMANNYTWFAIDKAVVPSSFTYAKLPAHYVYHVSSSSLYYYNKLKDYRGNNYYIRTIKQSRDLYRNLGF